ncbi:hypothetical protein JOD29_001792 [Lysinibacillus composti]|nr:hypothetical protein [Lysinibacillus composti]
MYVFDVIVRDTTQYQVYFRTSGKYNLHVATLVLQLSINAFRVVLLTILKLMLMQLTVAILLKFTNLVLLYLIILMGMTSDCI